ncbi:hypothetical protein AWE51_01440 [Aquimarina aggregata]|uniref:histidine kinase n=1 Tax=Aquimarina aggregata TaxID=1642818 RepID=A0A163C7V1_9FLAO|nr:response regulator [Aquimarina aggregata]KZS42135.1 hypothetical protein AWE51_01440 [Aquimarina aggregata]
MGSFRIILLTYSLLVAIGIGDTYGQDKAVNTVNDSLQHFMSESKKFRAAFKIRKSLDYAIRTIDLAHQLNNDNYKYRGHYMMASNYQVVHDFKNMEFHGNEALKYARKTKDTIAIVYSLNVLGGVYSDGYEDLAKSIKYFNESLAIAEKLKDQSKKMAPILNIGWAYVDQKKYDLAFPYLNQAQNIIENHPGEVSIIAINDIKYLFGKYYAHKNNYEKANKLFDEVIQLAEEKEIYSILSNTYKAKSDTFEEMGHKDSAFYTVKKHLYYRDHLLDEEKLRQIETAKVNYSLNEFKREIENSKKEEEYLAKIERGNLIIIISSISLVLLVGSVFFFYLGYRSKQKLNVTLQQKNKELVEAKLEAEKLTNVKSQFISTVSHELRTPLYGVVGITTLLLEDNDILAKHKKLLNSLKFSGDYLLDLINKVLKISKIESNKEELAKTPTNLALLSQNLLHSFEYQAKNKNNKLVLDIQKELPEVVNIDSLKLSEILINLIGNSSKFTENGTIWLRVKVKSIEKDTTIIRYEVEDSGVGIPDDKKEFVFEKFSQVGREVNKSEGTGLGLSIVKNLLDIMGSQIHLDSKEGRGTKFYFDLELEVIDENDNNQLDIDNTNTAQSYRRILVAEDNKINQIVTKNLLNLIGYDCIIVENGFNALQMVKKEDFDLILMDLNMPYLNGIEATKRIREFDQETPIIALTASELSEVKGECLAIGMNDIINKPLNKNDLRNIITKNLQY